MSNIITNTTFFHTRPVSHPTRGVDDVQSASQPGQSDRGGASFGVITPPIHSGIIPLISIPETDESRWSDSSASDLIVLLAITSHNLVFLPSGLDVLDRLELDTPRSQGIRTLVEKYPTEESIIGQIRETSQLFHVPLGFDNSGYIRSQEDLRPFLKIVELVAKGIGTLSTNIQAPEFQGLSRSDRFGSLKTGLNYFHLGLALLKTSAIVAQNPRLNTPERLRDIFNSFTTHQVVRGHFFGDVPEGQASGENAPEIRPVSGNGFGISWQNELVLFVDGKKVNGTSVGEFHSYYWQG